MSILSTIRRWRENWKHRGSFAVDQFRGILTEECRTCGAPTTGFDERGPLCFGCSIVKALEEA